jgi:putative ABC transport system substrate-binding protein
MNRRGFLVAATALAMTRALAAPGSRTIGFLLEGEGFPRRLTARLAELGHDEGRTLRFEVRRVPVGASVAEIDAAARALAASGAEILLAWGAIHLPALHRATRTIPIVSMGVSNPVGLGLARSLGRPGGNVTGLSFGLEEVASLQIGTLKVLRPRLSRLVFVLAERDARLGISPEHAAAAAALGIETSLARVARMADLERAFSGIRDAPASAAWVAPMPDDVPLPAIASMAGRLRLATHSMSAEGVRAGLLCSYWITHADPNARVAATVDKILRGGRPSEIPFELPDKTTFALNRSTAVAIGASVDAAMLLRATEVVE